MKAGFFKIGCSLWKWRAFVLIWMLSLISTGRVFAQSVTVSGHISDELGEPLIGATVQVKGSDVGTVSDIDGMYVLQNLSQDDVLVFSYIGYESLEKKVSGTTLDVVLKEASSMLDDVVVIGYGTMRKRDLTGAITSVNSETIIERNPTNVFDALQGSAPGVQIVSNSGAPGEGASIRIRGTSTFGSGTNPLYVVDGVPMEDISAINPGDIQSMEILKDAASAAIYGSRSANGVIIITTKRGVIGKPKVDIKYIHSYSNISHILPQTTPDDWRLFNSVRYNITGKDKYVDADPLRPYMNFDGNQKDLVFRTAKKNQVDLSVSGATDKMDYYLSTGFYNEQGIIINSDFKRYTLNFNASYKVAKRFKIGNNIQFAYSDQKGIDEGAVTGNFYNWAPIWNPITATGDPRQNVGGKNSMYSTAMLERHQTRNLRGTALIYGELQINEYLKFRSNLSGTFDLDRQYYFRPIALGSQNDKTMGSDYTNLDYNWMNENYLSYDRTIKDHAFSVMFGNSTQAWYEEYAQVRGSEWSTDYIWTVNAATKFNPGDNYSRLEDHSMASFFLRGTYNWKSRYLFAGNLRYDGSSRFAKDSRWGLFPSASLGWRFSDEGFMKWAKPFLADGKFRVSYGVTGNESIGNYAYWPAYSDDGMYNGVGGLSPNLASATLGWERTEQFNVGLDMSMMDSRINVIFDYYKKHTTDLLYNTEVPKETGYNSVTQNVGAMDNHGFELSVNANVLRINDWNWDVSFNISKNVSKIDKLANGTPFYTGNDNAIYVQEGHKIGEFYGYRHDGIFAYDESNAFDENWTQLTPVFNDKGDFSHYELNGDVYNGVVNQKTRNGQVLKGGDVNWLDNPEDPNRGDIDDNDKVLLGCAQPDVYGGLSSTLSWKNISLYVSFYYSLGGEIFNWQRYKRNNLALDWTAPEGSVIHSMWTKQGDIALHPNPDNGRKDLNATLGASDFWMEDASYVKLRNLKLSYALPESICQKVLLKNVSIYFYGNNLLTWTKYKGFDPEFGGDVLAFGIDSGKYPRKRELGFGINIGF